MLYVLPIEVGFGLGIQLLNHFAKSPPNQSKVIINTYSPLILPNFTSRAKFPSKFVEGEGTVAANSD